jgi:hypothetical protein
MLHLSKAAKACQLQWRQKLLIAKKTNPAAPDDGVLSRPHSA